jgi:hypothetical protein
MAGRFRRIRRPDAKLNAVDEDQASTSAAQGIPDTDARLAARLKQLLHTPGISDKDRKLVERNLKRLLEAQERQYGR